MISTVRFRKFPNSGGIPPVNLLFLMSSCDKSCMFPNSGGISPVKPLYFVESVWSSPSFDISGGIVPVSPFLFKPIPVTRIGLTAMG